MSNLSSMSPSCLQVTFPNFQTFEGKIQISICFKVSKWELSGSIPNVFRSVLRRRLTTQCSTTTLSPPSPPPTGEAVEWQASLEQWAWSVALLDPRILYHVLRFLLISLDRWAWSELPTFLLDPHISFFLVIGLCIQKTSYFITS